MGLVHQAQTGETRTVAHPTLQAEWLPDEMEGLVAQSSPTVHCQLAASSTGLRVGIDGRSSNGQHQQMH